MTQLPPFLLVSDFFRSLLQTEQILHDPHKTDIVSATTENVYTGEPSALSSVMIPVATTKLSKQIGQTIATPTPIEILS